MTDPIFAAAREYLRHSAEHDGGLSEHDTPEQYADECARDIMDSMAAAIAAYEAAQIRPLNEAPKFRGARILVAFEDGTRAWYYRYKTGYRFAPAGALLSDAPDVLGWVREDLSETNPTEGGND